MHEQKSATVETLTAEVRVLMVGKRQVTLSVARQLDVMEFGNDEPGDFRPFGRVRTGIKTERARRIPTPRTPNPMKHERDLDGRWVEFYEAPPAVELIGRRVSDGSLVLFVGDPPQHADDALAAEWADFRRMADSLPLIVLAGLR